MKTCYTKKENNKNNKQEVQEQEQGKTFSFLVKRLSFRNENIVP